MPRRLLARIGIVFAAAAAVGVTSSASAPTSAAAPAVTPRNGPTGYLFKVIYGPVCRVAPSRTCLSYPVAGVTLTLYRNNVVAGRAHTNKDGRATMRVKPLAGRYVLRLNGLVRGKPYDHRQVTTPPIAGLMMPFALTICAAGDYC